MGIKRNIKGICRKPKSMSTFFRGVTSYMVTCLKQFKGSRSLVLITFPTVQHQIFRNFNDKGTGMVLTFIYMYRYFFLFFFLYLGSILFQETRFFWNLIYFWQFSFLALMDLNYFLELCWFWNQVVNMYCDILKAQRWGGYLYLIDFLD